MMCISEALRLLKKNPWRTEYMNKAQRQDMVNEFKEFRIPENFGGGCKKSVTQLGYCALLTWEGKLSKIQFGCPLYRQCEGRKYTFKP